jgi:hypothetical protein
MFLFHSAFIHMIPLVTHETILGMRKELFQSESTTNLHCLYINKQLSESAVLTEPGLTILCDIQINGVWISDVLLYSMRS